MTPPGTTPPGATPAPPGVSPDMWAAMESWRAALANTEGAGMFPPGPAVGGPPAPLEPGSDFPTRLI
jgi:hypothetical protein